MYDNFQAKFRANLLEVRESRVYAATAGAGALLLLRTTGKSNSIRLAHRPPESYSSS